MPTNEAKQIETEENLTQKGQPVSFRKAQGMRLGTLDDWREGSATSGKTLSRHGHAIRDGR